jgi:hypothetical protein
MKAVQPSARHEGPGRSIVIPSRVLAALDHFEPTEQSAVRQVFQELQHLSVGAPADPRLRRIAGDEPIYLLSAAPRVRLFVRLAPDAPVEVLEIVRPETLQRMFSAPAVATSRE